jgi:hypothetical protein
MAKKDPEFFQVSVGQRGQDLGVDRVIAERLLVALQPEIVQPSRDVHDILPHAMRR